MNDVGAFEQEARAFVESLIQHASDVDEGSIVLTGSAARGERGGLWSDVDLLVLNVDVGEAPPIVHLIQMTASEFATKLRSGDDVVQWAARFGRPLLGSETWNYLVARWLPLAPWPDFRVKLGQARRRLQVSRDLLGVGDGTSAQKELVYAVSHLARAILLSRGIFPLSRPELPAQLSAVHESDVADALGRISSIVIDSSHELDEVVRLVEERHRRLEAVMAPAAG
jgi:predicted nucleotidyltransferase/uncharacterized protein (UPF0332 family)